MEDSSSSTHDIPVSPLPQISNPHDRYRCGFNSLYMELYWFGDSMMCPNCEQIIQGTDCQWCHYSLTASRPSRVKVAERTNGNSWVNILTWIASIVLAIIIGAFAFIHFSPAYNIYMVRSESMKPAINMGDMVITGPINGPFNGEVKPEAIVTYERGKGLVTHRVVSVDGSALVTKGEALEETDPWPVTLSDVRGIYLLKLPYVGYALNFIRTKLGWFLTIILPATLLVALLAKEIVKEALGKA